MVVYANILLPLYIWPLPQAWDPLLTAARQYPDVTFTAVINPYNGPYPDSNGCPPAEYIDGLTALNNLPNIQTMGYVHTANRFDCGPDGNWICACSAPIAEVKQNISTYASWSTLSCGASGADIHIDSLFIDEAPNTDGGACLSYMTELTEFAKSSLVTPANGGQVLFNPGGATELSYFDVADVIVIMENTQERFDNLSDIDSLNGDGKYYAKSSVILYAHSSDPEQVRSTVDEVLSLDRDAFHSLFVTDLTEGQYQAFSPNWLDFVAAVDETAAANREILGSESRRK
jgi:hypothetical protein